MDRQQKALFLRYQPYIYRDRRDPFPIRFIGCTAFTEKMRSASFPKWVVDPQQAGTGMILEYAIYYDYDIQHMYDLEHIWVGVDPAGRVTDCWCSFHGMRLRAAGVPDFRLEGTHPVLYSQPGKHAMLPHPELFGLHPQFSTACTSAAGGGVLLPELLNGAVQTDPALDARVTAYIRSRYAFEPSMEFIREVVTAEQLISWQELLDRIPGLLLAQIDLITQTEFTEITDAKGEVQ